MKREAAARLKDMREREDAFELEARKQLEKENMDERKQGRKRKRAKKTNDGDVTKNDKRSKDKNGEDETEYEHHFMISGEQRDNFEEKGLGKGGSIRHR